MTAEKTLIRLARQLELAAADVPDKVALRTDTSSLTFSEFDGLASEMAGSMRAHGIGPGDRVAIMAGSHPEFLAAIYGAWKLGAITVAINAQLGADEARYQLSNSGAKLAVADPGKSLETVKVALDLSTLDGVVPLPDLRFDPVVAVDVPIDADATIFYTSGTTGVPKGATHTHRALVVLLDQVHRHFSVTSEDVFLSVLPAYLLSILVLGPLSSLSARATCRLMGSYEPMKFAQHVRADRTSIIGASIPMMFSDLLELPAEQAENVDLSSIRAASCGGSPMPPEIRKAFEDRYDFRFVHAYGGTEGPAVVSTDPFDRDRRFDSVGIPLPHIQVTIEDDDGLELPPGQVGEICTSAWRNGPYAGLYEPIRCYWAMPEATAEALRGGKLHWGDLGYLDEDGFLYLVERKKDMIIRGGMNVYPKELEVLLYEDPRIAECAVVAAPHQRYGEVPYAFVRTSAGATIAEAEVLGLVNGRTAKFKHLAGVTIVEDFPRNALGKILKRALRAGLTDEAETSSLPSR